nr:uncharacterized protein LOC127301161 isoform X2 [Lolium perenne]
MARERAVTPSSSTSWSAQARVPTPALFHNRRCKEGFDFAQIVQCRQVPSMTTLEHHASSEEEEHKPLWCRWATTMKVVIYFSVALGMGPYPTLHHDELRRL